MATIPPDIIWHWILLNPVFSISLVKAAGSGKQRMLSAKYW
jgi:hypothetical protein